MSESVSAVYENGVFRPLEPVDWQERQRVTVTLSEEAVSESAASKIEEFDGDDRPWRGVFTPPRPLRTLFTREIEAQTPLLPKRTPSLNMNWHRSDGDDE